MAILGLLGSEQFSAERFTNVRRSVFYFYPNGAAPLTGLLSMMTEEDTDDPEFSWYEKRLSTQSALTITQGSSKGPFLTAAFADAGDPLTITAGTTYAVKVADTAVFRVGHIIRVTVTTGSTVNEVTGVVSIVDQANLRLSFVANKTVASIDNGTTNENVGKEVLVIGSAFAQGAVGSSGDIWNLPVSAGNYCQIFRYSFSLTGTALKTGAKFDETGPYKDKSKEASVYHMIEMEKNFLFSSAKSKTVDGTTGLPTYTTGGLMYFLQQYEVANSIYRGGSGAAAVTLDTDDEKRIIENTGATINERSYDTYLERVFRVTNNTSNEKLVFCGSGFLSVINQLYRSKSVLNADLPMKETYGMSVVRHLTPFGTIYYKTHPLFSQNANLRYNALFLDMQNLRYRYVQGRDTELLKNRQPNNADYRQDEWLTEAGLEVRFPESFMYLKNVTSYTP